MTELLLEATDVGKRYGAVAALRSASLAVRPGEVHALMGANGAGKSTLVKILTGVVQPDSGTILVNGKPYRARNPAEARAAGADVTPVHDKDASPALVAGMAKAGDLVLTMGAGDVTDLGPRILDELSK